MATSYEKERLVDAMHFECPFLSINLEGGTAAQRAKELVELAVQKRDFSLGYYELADLLFAVPFCWPSFDLWERKFSEAGYKPMLWPDPQGAGVEARHQAVLSILQGISVAARKAALDGPYAYAMPASTFSSRYGAQALYELEVAGHISRMRTAAEKLECISLQNLRVIQKQVSARGAKSRAELAKRINAVASEDALQALLPEDAKEDYIRIVDLLALLDHDWVASRKQIVGLYLQTMTSFIVTLRWAGYATQLQDDRVIVIQMPTDCGFCSPLHNRILSVGRDDLPPYHPGCRCSISPVSLEAKLQKR